VTIYTNDLLEWAKAHTHRFPSRRAGFSVCDADEIERTGVDNSDDCFHPDERDFLFVTLMKLNELALITQMTVSIPTSGIFCG
jgi:hypothetical protein